MKHTNEKGYVLLGVLLLTFLSLLVTAGMLDSAASNAKTRAIVNTQADYYYEVEKTLNNVVGWLQQNSKSLVTPFLAANFASNFTITDPTLGDNEGQHFSVPTMVKMNGTNNSVMLSNNNFFGTNAFPAATHIDTGANFDAATSFATTDFGGANARIILVWAKETDSNYQPIFRIDVVTGNNPDRGVHSFSYVYSGLVTSNGGAGFFGETQLDFVTPNNNCASYKYVHDGANWNKGDKRKNCPAASDGVINIGSKIEGTADTTLDPGINYTKNGANVSEGTCEGAGCHSYNLPPLANPCTSYVDITISANIDLPLLALPQCYGTVTVNSNKSVGIKDTSTPYYIQAFDFKGNNSSIDFGTVPVGQQIELNVLNNVSGNNHLNGNRLINPNNAPHQVQMNYHGTDELILNGTANMNMNITAPNAKATVQGNFLYYGGLQAKQLEISGNSEIFYDENLGSVPVISDIKFALKKTSQRYR